MKIVSFKCDFCGKIIDRVNVDVETLHRGKIGYWNNEILSNKEGDTYHFHSGCLSNFLMNMHEEDEKKPDTQEPKPGQSNPETSEYTPTKKEDSRKDLGKLMALLNAGWTMKEIARELGVSMSCAYRWKNEAEEA